MLPAPLLLFQYKKSGVDNSINFINLNSDNTKKIFLGNRRDEYSPFRQHLISARKRFKSKGRECSITLKYLKELWEKQGGKCPYTGWKLDNPETTEHWNGRQLHPKTASLNRINTALGYIPGNVQFVSVIANFAKRDFPEDELLERIDYLETIVGIRQGLDEFEQGEGIPAEQALATLQQKLGIPPCP